MIERDDDGEFFAVCMSVKDGASFTTATGHTVNEAKVHLEDKIKNVLKRKGVSLVLMPMSSLETHLCSPHYKNANSGFVSTAEPRSVELHTRKQPVAIDSKVLIRKLVIQ